MAREKRRRDGLDELHENGMMAHLLGALERGEDIGHYGRLVFAMVARHFLDEDRLVGLLARGGCDRDEARALSQQVQQRGYNPPRRERVLEWQARQQFPICPNPEDPDACNVYKDLQFPDGVYEHIEEYHEQKAEASA